MRLASSMRVSSAMPRSPAASACTPLSPIWFWLRLSDVSAGRPRWAMARPRSAAAGSPSCVSMHTSETRAGIAPGTSPAASVPMPSSVSGLPSRCRSLSEDSAFERKSMPTTWHSGGPSALKRQLSRDEPRTASQLVPRWAHSASEALWRSRSCCSCACISPRRL
eukprot:scaffold16223_cov66-Phaeocystis_antarctica.AAC.2